MSEARQLVDTSVLLRSHQSTIADRLESLAVDGKLWTCRMVDLEYLYSVKAKDVPDVFRWRRALPEVPVTSATMDRALEIMESLAAAGRHRHAKGSDCIIAASAQMAGISVLHYDRDFDRIAEVVNIETEWVAPPGSLDEPARR